MLLPTTLRDDWVSTDKNIMKNNFLNDILKIQNETDSKKGSNKITNRAKFIVSSLKSNGIKVVVDNFEDQTTRRLLRTFGFGIQGMIKRSLFRNGKYYYNIEVLFKSSVKTKDTIVFTAHHDVVNIKSKNCQDNTASVVNLMNLCLYLKDFKKLTKNILVVFTDCEEFGMSGAKRLSQKINNDFFGNVNVVINSELTGNGDLIWCESQNGGEWLEGLIKEVPRRNCPPNDSYAFRNNDIISVCFGLLPKKEFDTSVPQTWKICHLIGDDESIINQYDMDVYVEFLKKLL